MKTGKFWMLMALAVLGFSLFAPRMAGATPTIYFTDADNGGSATGKVLRTNLDGSFGDSI